MHKLATTLAIAKIACAAPLLLVLNKADNTLVFVDPAKMQVVGSVATGNGPHEVAVAPTERLAFVANYGTGPEPGSTISVIDIDDRKEVERIDTRPFIRPHGLAVVGGKLYVTAEANRALLRYDIKSRKLDWAMGTGQDATHMVVANGDGSRLYTANIVSGTVTAMTLSAGPGMPAMKHITIGPQPEGIALSPDGSELWAGHNGDGRITIVDARAGTVKETIEAGQMPIRIRFARNGELALVSDPKTGELTVFDRATRKALKRIPIGEACVGIATGSDGKAYVASMATGKVTAVDLAKLEIAGTVQTGNGPDGVAWVD